MTHGSHPSSHRPDDSSPSSPRSRPPVGEDRSTRELHLLAELAAVFRLDEADPGRRAPDRREPR